MTLFAFLAAAAAIVAAFIAVRNARFVRLHLQQVRSVDAPVAVSVLAGRAERTIADDRRSYEYNVSITNGSPAEKVFDRLVLRVSFRTRANFCGAVDVPPDADASDPALRLPLRIAPGQTLTGTLRFETSNIVPRHSRIDAHTILIGNGEGERYPADASLPDVVRHDHDGTGPATWGWD